MGHLVWCCLVWGHSLGMGSLHGMCWSSVTLSAILGKVVSRNFPNPFHLTLHGVPHFTGTIDPSPARHPDKHPLNV